MSETTLFDLYRHDFDAPRPDHYTHFVPGGRRVLSTGEFFASAACLAEGLAVAGVSSGDRVMLLSDNRPEWHIADLAVLDLGAVDVPVYGTLTPSQIAYQVNDSGAVAVIVENLELKLAADGELLVRGPSVSAGYWNKPRQTAEVFSADGFFATGDIADLDDDGFLLITDRKKDLIVTAGGKNVAPQPIESDLKRSPLVDQAVLIGDGRPETVALISPNLEELQRWAARHGVVAASPAELVVNAVVVAAYEETVAAVNARLARYEQIKRVCVLPTPLTLEAGHLTPTLKVKRRVVEREFAGLIAEMYSGG